jgi:hypothetical protein
MKISFSFNSAAPPPLPKYVGKRCLYGNEGGYTNPNGMPCVRPATNSPAVPFSEALQWLTYRVMTFINPAITPEKWRAIFSNGRFATNTQGFDKTDEDGNPIDPRADYVNGRDLDKPLPKLMKSIFCGNKFVTQSPPERVSRIVKIQTVNGLVDHIEFLPGVHAVDASKITMPITQADVDEVLNNVWYYYAVSEWYDPPRVNHFPQGSGNPVVIPHILTVPVYYPAWWFEPWENGTLPDPLTIYHPI